jgi:hypothetical protein
MAIDHEIVPCRVQYSCCICVVYTLTPLTLCRYVALRMSVYSVAIMNTS